MSMLEEYVRDLAELVNRDCGTTNCAGVTSAAEVMKRHFESIGWEAELVDLGPTAGRGLICRNKPGSTECDVIFNAHLDTVFPDGTAAARPFSIEGTTAHGPGCSDCKSGVLAIFYACRNARPEDLERLSVWCVFNPDEELGSRASKEWLRELSTHAKAALVFEAARAGGELVRSRKGSSNIRFTFKGLTAHAGNNPQDGRNANVAAMRLALAAYELDDKTRGTTVNPGLIHGGTGANIISDHAEVTLDLRFWNDEDGRELISKIRTRALVEKITDAASEAGFDARWVDAGGASDGNHMAEAGIPVVDGCGPAGGGFHSEREFLRLETVEERIIMIVNLLKRL